MSAMTNYLENKLIDHVFRGISFPAPATLYFALLTAAPDDTNVINEVAGGSYARVPVVCNTTNWAGTQAAGSTTTSSGTSGVTSNNNIITFPSPTADWGTVVAVAVMDASSGGNALFQGMLNESVTVVSGGPAPSFPVSTFTLQMDN